MGPLIGARNWRWTFLAGIIALAAGGDGAGVASGWVKVKMLPFDNKSEFQIILNMPEGSALERTAQAAREIAAAVREEPEVTDYQIYVGTRRRSTSTAWSGITSCGGARTWPTCKSILSTSTSAKRRATTSPNAFGRASPPSRTSSARAWPWPKCRRARPCCKRWSPRSTVRPKNPPRAGPKSPRHLQTNARRGGRRLVCRGGPAEDALRHRQGKSGLARHQRGDDFANAAPGRGRRID